MEKQELEKSLEEDILYSSEMWNKYSHDWEKMQELFYMLYFKYMEEIENLSQGLRVISPYEEDLNTAATYRSNVSTLVQRLIDFKKNDCDNDKLKSYYLKEGQINENGIEMRFNMVRKEILEKEAMGKREKDEIIEKLDAVEEIIKLQKTKKEKWELLRPYVFWVSGKDLETAMEILPLFLSLDEKGRTL